MGPSLGEKQQYNLLNDIAGFGTSHGQSDISQSEDFWRGILSGDPTKVSQTLAPQISAIRQQSQQRKNTMAQFSPRSGGTAAAAASIDEGTQGAIDNMVGQLTGTAASELGRMGEGLLSTGASSSATAFGEANTMNKEEQARWADIFNSIKNILSGAAAGYQVGGISGGIKSGLGGVFE